MSDTTDHSRYMPQEPAEAPKPAETPKPADRPSFRPQAAAPAPQRPRPAAAPAAPAAPKAPRPAAAPAPQEPRPAAPAPAPQEPRPAARAKAPGRDSRRLIYIITGVAVVLILIAGAAILMLTSKNSRISREAEIRIEQLEMEKDELRLSNEYAKINDQFAQVENQSILLANDSIVEKYTAAKAKVEKLLQELNAEKTKNREQIAKLEGEINTLKSILREYVARIDELTRENEHLRNENNNVKRQNQQLTSNLADAKRSNEELSERMTLAEKLNVTGVNLIALKANDKVEKNITKAARLKVTFTLPPNNSTPVGEKKIYLRIINPEGDLIRGNGQTFTFEGQTLDCTASISVDYSGEEIGGNEIYSERSVFNPGEYTVELFADNFRIYTGRFMMTKK